MPTSGTRTLMMAMLCLATAPAIASGATDDWLTRPVDDATYRTYLEFFEYARDQPLETTVMEPTTVDGVRKQHVSFVSTPGVRVTAQLYRQDTDAPESPPAIVLLHGGNAAGKDEPRTDNFSRGLARAGVVVLAIDLLHYGERKTGLLDTFTLQEKAERLYSHGATYLDWVIQTVKDVGRSIDFLVAEQSVDPSRIILLGFSRGAVLGTIVAGAEQRLAGAALLYGGHAGSWADIEHRAAACPANYIGRISPRPLLMINGERDQLFRKETAVLPLQALAGEQAEFVWLDTGHVGGGDAASSALMSWLATHFE